MSGISRREFNKKFAAGLVGAAALGSGLYPFESLGKAKFSSRRPNFVIVCSDQHSAKYSRMADHPFIQTPNLERIAKRGVTFTNAYCGSPLCVPGRSSLMTGMYASDLNSFCNSTVMDSSYPTWGKRLRDSDYYCWAVGKQDLNPNVDLGFVEKNVTHEHASKPDITSLFRRPVGYRINEREGVNGSIREKKHKDSNDTIEAINFLINDTAKLDKPWAVFVGLTEPHPAWSGLKKYYDYYLEKVQPIDVSIDELEKLPLPYQVMKNFKRISIPISQEKIKRAMAAYFSMISELDDYVGEIYKSLEETNQLENTYFVYTSDHGESLGEHGLWYKNNLYDCAVRVPMIISNPSLPKGVIIDKPVAHVDLVATMIELAGIDTAKELRGKSLLKLIEGTEVDSRYVYSESHSEGNPTGSFMIKKGDWKLIHFSYYDDLLFNLNDDPAEKNNLAHEPVAQNVLNELRAILYREVNPEEITERAFSTQKKVLDGYVTRLNEEELFNLLKSRLGEGEARVMAKSLKGYSK